MARTNREDRRSSNRDSRIVTTHQNGAVKTRTIYRNDTSIRASVMTENGATKLRIRDPFSGDLVFSGAEARTIYRTLQRHYEAAGLSTY